MLINPVSNKCSSKRNQEANGKHQLLFSITAIQYISNIFLIGAAIHLVKCSECHPLQVDSFYLQTPTCIMSVVEIKSST